MTADDVLALPFKVDEKGYASIWLGRGHPLARSSGQQRRARAIAMICLGRPLQADEHVHHRNGDRLDDRPENLEVVLAEYHGALHCAFTSLTVVEGERLVEREEPVQLIGGTRQGPVLSAPEG